MPYNLYYSGSLITGRGLDLSLRMSGRNFFKRRNPAFINIVLGFESFMNGITVAQGEPYFLDMMREEQVLQMDPVAWWSIAHHDMPHKITKEFFELCRVLLRLPASSAGIERNFSSLKNTYSDNRHNLLVEKAEKICFINNNRIT